MCKAASVTQLTRQARNEIPARRDERRARLLDHDWVIATRHKLIVSVNRYDRGRAGAITYPGPTYVAIIMANIPLRQLLLTHYLLACNKLATLSNFKENMRDEEGRLKPEVLFRGGPNENSKGKASRQNVPMRARCNVAKIGIINGNPRKEIIQHFILITGAGLKGISIMCKAASVTQLTRQATNEIPARRDERRAQLLDHDWVIATRHKLIVSVNRYDRGRAGAITYPGPTYVAIIMANIPLCQLLLTLYILACNNLATLSNFKENMRDEEGRLKPEVLFRGGPNENSKGSWGISKGFFPYPVPVDDGGPDYA
ncbi:unnamed protein product [Pieris brassicae]|uniref:Uncharacterized protein n=1 Tax=Pieris brassicae TaxID=7116 RepID=A0A9P0XHT8_PIEBR|nr:unnamed protein product [Pieris brassicae]